MVIFVCLMVEMEVMSLNGVDETFIRKDADDETSSNFTVRKDARGGKNSDTVYS